MNLIDYIKKTGDKTFSELAFNEIDNAILCQVTYVSFEDVLPNRNPYTIAELNDYYFSVYTEEDIKKDKSLIAKSPLVLKEMAKYKRYKDIIMHHFINTNSELSSLQFAAMQFDLDDATTYVSFRGTDDQMLGWKEDFEMAYKKIKGFKYAKNYINRFCYHHKKYRVGGHSKGGALAIYGSTKCFSFIRKNIIEVYCNDGPGIKKDYIKDRMGLIKDRYIKIVPENDLIGIIFDDDYEHSIVKTNTIGVYQHDMLSWQIKNNSFIKAKALSKSSSKLRNSFNEYIENVPLSEINNITVSLFDFFKKVNINKVSELFSLSFNKITSMLKNIPTIDDSTKKIIFNIIWVFLESNLPSNPFTSDKIIDNRGRK